MISRFGEQVPRKTGRWLIPALGYVISVAALVWVYWGFDWRSEIPKLAAADWRWVVVAMLSEVLTYFLQGWRWRVLLKPVARAGYLHSVQAIFVGLFANSVLPFRSGEVIRTYLQSRWSKIPFAVCVSSVLAERLLDGVILALAFYLVSWSVPLPGYLRDGGVILAVVVGVLALAFAVVVVAKQHAHAAVSKSRWADELWHVVEGLHTMGRSPSLAGAGLLSAAYFVAQLVPFVALAHDWKLGVPLPGLAVVLVIMRIGTVVPQAPSNVGGFQFFTVVALDLLGVEKTTAAGFATVMFLAVTVPLWIAGAVASALTGIGIKELQRRASGAGVTAPREGEV